MIQQRTPPTFPSSRPESDDVRDYAMYIDGAWRTSQSGLTFATQDPFSEFNWARVPAAELADVDVAVTAARRALTEPAWARMSGRDRARLMRKLAALVDAHGRELAILEVLDNGKLLREMSAQLQSVAEFFEYFAGWADKIDGRVIATNKTNFLVYTLPEPVGVVAGITAWNSPLLLLAYKLAPALAAGCTFVAKPASAAPTSTLGFARLIEEAGFPSGVFNTVTGSGESTGQALVSHLGVNKVAFTGSTSAGKDVASGAAGHVIPTTLELGGKSANIVFADADMDLAVEGAMAAIFAAAGQSCVAGSRLLVHKSIFDSFVADIVDRAKRIVLGDPLDSSTEMGPVASRQQYDKILAHIEMAVSQGATIAAGGSRPLGFERGFLIEPTVLVNVSNADPIAQTEVFGPVLCAIPFDTEEEAVAIANSSVYGLAAGVWTRDIRRAHRMARALEAGTVWINSYRVVSYEVPTGGYKSSGYGRENGLEGLREYIRTKAVWIEIAGTGRDPFRLG